MHMSKKTLLIGVVVLILALGIAVYVLNRNRDEEKPVNLDGVTAEIDPDGLVAIRYADEGISISIPSIWNPKFYKELEYGVNAFYKYGDNTVALMTLALFENESIENAIAARRPGFDYQTEKEEMGIKYVGFSAGFYQFGSNDPISTPDNQGDNYIVGRILVVDDGVVSLECLTTGPQYADLISDCNRIVESLSIE